MVDITVPAPDERTAEFYQFFGAWLAGALGVGSAQGKGSSAVRGGLAEVQPNLDEAGVPPRIKPWGDTNEDLADAVKLLRKCTAKGRALFDLLMDNPDVRFTGQQIADEVKLVHGAYSVAGVLGYPARHAAKFGRGLPSTWHVDPETGDSTYTMSKARAELFKAARQELERTG